MTTEQDEYILGTDPDELERLRFQHHVWVAPMHELLARAGLGAGQRVLDLGCGPGFTTLELAQFVGPTGRVVASDQSKRFLTTLRVDGGMSASDWSMQFLADILGAPVDRPRVLETTALGAAWLAGMRCGLYPGPEGFAESWQLDHRFTPALDAAQREARVAGWRDAVGRTLAR